MVKDKVSALASDFTSVIADLEAQKKYLDILLKCSPNCQK
jgi:hypothetical protein